MLALVNDVLDLSRIEAGQLKVSPEPVALMDIIHDAVALMQPLADAGKVTLPVDASGLGTESACARRCSAAQAGVAQPTLQRDQVQPRGRPRRCVRRDPRYPARVRALVSDTGIGIAAKT